MIKRVNTVPVVLLLLVAGSACGDDDSKDDPIDHGGSGGSSGSGGDAGPTRDSGSTRAGLHITGSAVAFAPGGFESPVAGMEICVFEDESIDCVDTDASGNFELAGIAASSEFTLSMIKDGYLSSLRHLTAGTEDFDIGATRVPELPLVAAFITAAGGDSGRVETTAFIVFDAWQPPGDEDGGVAASFNLDGMQVMAIEGATAKLTPASGMVVYVNDDESPDPALTGFSSRGWGGILNVEEGNYDLTFDASGLDCTLFGASGWKSTRANSLRARAVQGFLTHYNRALCE